jgi:aspartyl protease family protein
MKKQGGVYYIPCKINGSEMEFIFDTGASDITMSLTEALFLYKQKKLTASDFIGTKQYQIANGSIEEGTVVNLRSVEIGNKTLTNIQASIVHNTEAPLLLGQSALAKFGKIYIDYKNNEITFE